MLTAEGSGSKTFRCNLQCSAPYAGPILRGRYVLALLGVGSFLGGALGRVGDSLQEGSNALGAMLTHFLSLIAIDGNSVSKFLAGFATDITSPNLYSLDSHFWPPIR
jgi:hypothetical protein